jgi:hypothetical protein
MQCTSSYELKVTKCLIRLEAMAAILVFGIHPKRYNTSSGTLEEYLW